MEEGYDLAGTKWSWLYGRDRGNRTARMPEWGCKLQLTFASQKRWGRSVLDGVQTTNSQMGATYRSTMPRHRSSNAIPAHVAMAREGHRVVFIIDKYCRMTRQLSKPYTRYRWERIEEDKQSVHVRNHDSWLLEIPAALWSNKTPYYQPSVMSNEGNVVVQAFLVSYAEWQVHETELSTTVRHSKVATSFHDIL